jgi:hypothetical protein
VVPAPQHGGHEEDHEPTEISIRTLSLAGLSVLRRLAAAEASRLASADPTTAVMSPAGGAVGPGVSVAGSKIGSTGGGPGGAGVAVVGVSVPAALALPLSAGVSFFLGAGAVVVVVGPGSATSIGWMVVNPVVCVVGGKTVVVGSGRAVVTVVVGWTAVVTVVDVEDDVVSGGWGGASVTVRVPANGPALGSFGPTWSLSKNAAFPAFLIGSSVDVRPGRLNWYRICPPSQASVCGSWAASSSRKIRWSPTRAWMSVWVNPESVTVTVMTLLSTAAAGVAAPASSAPLVTANSEAAANDRNRFRRAIEASQTAPGAGGPPAGESSRAGEGVPATTSDSVIAVRNPL